MAGKYRMAAYALYLFNHEDPQMAISFIVTADSKELYDVLKDIGRRDEKILLYISGSLPQETVQQTASAAQTKVVTELNKVVQIV